MQVEKSPLIEFKPEGLYCPQADIFIDPWRPVKKALITHAHSDHARYGHQHYLAHRQSQQVMRLRLGQEISLQTLEYEENIHINGVNISFHPAGHIPGSAQIRLEYQGHIWVISGDYKTENDSLSSPFQPIPCHTFLTESTFGLPVFRWQAQQKIFEDIHNWWKKNQENGHCSVIFAYSLGKAQRIIKNLDTGQGKVLVHGAVWNTNQALEADGIILPKVEKVDASHGKADFKGALVIAPPSAMGSPWMKKFSPYRTAIASGWMNLRGKRRRRSADKGFVISDHADWQGLQESILATGAEQVYVTHGYSAILSRFLQEQGLDARDVATEFAGEQED